MAADDLMRTREGETDAVLRALVEGTAAETGEAFFAALVRNLCEALGTSGAWVTEYLADSRRLRARAFWLDGTAVSHYEYALPGTPCEPVIEGRQLVHVPDRVVELYPDDPDLKTAGAVSYMDNDEPDVLLETDRGANPVEHVLHALAGCLTTSMVYHAAARGIRLEEVESSLEGDLDLRGFLGMSDDVRNGYQNVRVRFRVKADATQAEIDELARLAQARSPVFDIVSNPVPVSVTAVKK